MKEREKIAAKTFRAVAGTSLVANMVAACARAVEESRLPPHRNSPE
ncbi:MAG: hypothetical protein ACOYT7_01965 [Patescibacteria group bacterium]